MAATVIKAAIERTPGLEPAMIEDVILGSRWPKQSRE